MVEVVMCGGGGHSMAGEAETRMGDARQVDSVERVSVRETRVGVSVKRNSDELEMTNSCRRKAPVNGNWSR